ncbi:MAG: hypothetical protein HY722_14450 [Planctomycetes bacterium]|nr:hypothetical protein [Planctomycetota bacterium]
MRRGPSWWVAVAVAVAVAVLAQAAPLGAQEAEAPGEAPAEGAADLEDLRAREYDRMVTIAISKNQEVDIDALLQQISHQIGKAVIPDPGLKGQRIRFLVEATVNYSIIRAFLQVNEIELMHEVVTREEDGTEVEVIKAYLERNLQQREIGSPTPVYKVGETLPLRNELITACFPVQYADPNGIFASLRQIITRARGRVGDILYVRGADVLIIKDLAPNVEYYRKIIEALDIPPSKLQEFEVIKLKYASANDIANVSGQLIQAIQTPAQVQAAMGGQPVQPKIVADPRTNQIVIFALRENIDQLLVLIADLDTYVDVPLGNFHVMTLKNTSAKDLASKLNELLSGRKAQVPGAGPEGANPAAPTLETRIVAEEQTNSLLIQAEPRDFAYIRDLVNQLDVRRPQVLIESQIFQVSEGDALSISVDVGALEDPQARSFRGGGILKSSNIFAGLAQLFNQSDPTQGAPIGIRAVGGAPQGLTALAYKGKNFDKVPLIINMLKTSNITNVLAEPYALTNDNVKATFSTKDENPIIRQDPGTAGSNINFSSVGGTQTAETTLTITPHISAGDYLRLEITLTIEDFTAPPDPTRLGARPKRSRKYEGEVTIPDNRYLVVGGVLGDRTEESQNRVPILGDIPILGYLFGSTAKQRQQFHVYVFIRPHILKDEGFENAGEVTRYWREKAVAVSGRELREPYGLGVDPRPIRRRMADIFGPEPNPFGE